MRSRLLALFVALAVLSAACGGSEAATTSGTAPAVESEVTSSETSSASDTDSAGAATGDEPGESVDTSPVLTPLVADDCVPFPSYSEGSFYVDDSPDRSDLREGLGGAALMVRLLVLDADTCEPLTDRPIELWSAAPDGRYSAVSTQPTNGAAALGESWLRGRQTTDGDGLVEFATLVPGWVPGQAPHLHVHTPIDDRRSFTARLLFDDAFTSEIYGESPYADRGPAAMTLAAEAQRDPGVERSVVAVSESADGWEANVVLAVSDAELREPPLGVVESTESPSDAAPDALPVEPGRNFDQIGGELQAMFTVAGEELGLAPEVIYEEFRNVTAEAPPDLPAIADRLGVTLDALQAALPLLAGGAPTFDG